MVKITDKLQHGVNFIYDRIPQPQPSSDICQNAKIVAHRGAWNLSDRPENTIAAFKPCVEKGLWAIEFDIRWTKDDQPVVHHDASTLRVFHKDLLISDFTLAELKEQIPQIPSFEEVVSLFGQKTHFMIELKTHLSKKQAQILKNKLNSLIQEKDYHIMSLNLDHFVPLSFLNPKTFVSIARTNIVPIYKKTLELNLGGLTGQYLLLNDKMKHNCEQQKIHTGTGFPTSKNILFRELNRGVDWIFTNKSLELKLLLESVTQQTQSLS